MELNGIVTIANRENGANSPPITNMLPLVHGIWKYTRVKRSLRCSLNMKEVISLLVLIAELDAKSSGHVHCCAIFSLDLIIFPLLVLSSLTPLSLRSIVLRQIYVFVNQFRPFDGSIWNNKPYCRKFECFYNYNFWRQNYDV